MKTVAPATLPHSAAPATSSAWSAPHANPPRCALPALALAVLLASLGTSSAHVALPSLAGAFDASFARVQWVVLAYLLAVTSLVVGAGRLGDLAGRRRLLVGGIVVFTAGSTAAGCAPSLGWLIAARALQGAGAAVMLAQGMALAGALLPKGQTGRAMGLLGTMSATGTALGPALGGGLIAAWGWRALFLLNLPLGLAAAWLAWRHLPADQTNPRGRRPRLDPWGTGLLILALSAYALAVTPGRGQFGPLHLLLLATAVAAAGGFVWAERRVPAPLVDLAWFHDRELRAGLLASALIATVLMTTLVAGPFYLTGALGLDPAGVGLVLAAGPLASALAAVPAGRVVERWGVRRATIAGLGAIGLGTLSLAAWATRLDVTGYVAAIVVITSGYALFQTANNTGVMDRAGAADRGVVSGLLNLSRNLGLITGASVMGAVFAAGAGTGDPVVLTPSAVAAGLRLAFAVATLLVIVALQAGTRLSRPVAPRGACDA